MSVLEFTGRQVDYFILITPDTEAERVTVERRETDYLAVFRLSSFDGIQQARRTAGELLNLVSSDGETRTVYLNGH